jgi:imidazolonepropionase-like amidohydrolase
MARLALINGRLIDGTGSAPRDGWGMVIDGAAIQAVGPTGSLRLPADARVIDVGGRTLMPGLIDAHTHLTYHVSEYALILQQMNESLEMNTIKAVESARVILEAGCTAVGDGGSRGNIAVAIRDAVNQGTIPGPKVVAAGQMISGSSGIADHTAAFGYIDADAFLGVVVNGPQEVRAAVRKQMRQGVDWVKVTASGTPGNFWIDGRTEDLSYEEIAAAVQEAAKFGRTVHAHAHNAAGMRNAARAGVISIHSGEFADEATLEVLKEHNCVFIPTIAWLHFRINEEYAREFTRAYKPTAKQLAWFIEDCRQAYEAAREAIKMAYRLGVPMGIGTDAAHVFPPFDIVREMEYFQELGIPPLEIITMGTKMSAQAIGRADVWGTLEPGKMADVLVVDGDPAANIAVLRDKARIVMILQDGRVVKDALTRAG